MTLISILLMSFLLVQTVVELQQCVRASGGCLYGCSRKSGGLKVAARLNGKKRIVKKAGDYSNEEDRWEVLFDGENEIVK